MMNRLLLSAIVLAAIPLMRATPVFAQDLPDFGSVAPVPGHPDFEKTEDGFLILQGDMVVAECGSVQRADFTSTILYNEVIEICTESASSRRGSSPDGASVSQGSLPETGGPPFVCLLALLLCSVGFVGRAVARRTK